MFENLPIIITFGFFSLCVAVNIYNKFFVCDCNWVTGATHYLTAFVRNELKAQNVTLEELRLLRSVRDSPIPSYLTDYELLNGTDTGTSILLVRYCPKCKTIRDERKELSDKLSKAIAEVRQARTQIKYYEETEKLITDITRKD